MRVCLCVCICLISGPDPEARAPGILWMTLDTAEIVKNRAVYGEGPEQWLALYIDSNSVCLRLTVQRNSLHKQTFNTF